MVLLRVIMLMLIVLNFTVLKAEYAGYTGHRDKIHSDQYFGLESFSIGHINRESDETSYKNININFRAAGALSSVCSANSLVECSGQFGYVFDIGTEEDKIVLKSLRIVPFLKLENSSKGFLTASAGNIVLRRLPELITEKYKDKDVDSLSISLVSVSGKKITKISDDFAVFYGGYFDAALPTASYGLEAGVSTENFKVNFAMSRVDGGRHDNAYEDSAQKVELIYKVSKNSEIKVFKEWNDVNVRESDAVSPIREKLSSEQVGVEYSLKGNFLR